MTRLNVPSSLGQDIATLRRQVNEVDRKQIPSAQLVDQLPRGIVGKVNRTTAVYPISGTTRTSIVVLNDIPMSIGRRYRITGRVQAYIEGAGYSIIELGVTYTIDGSTPTTGSSVLTAARSICMDGGWDQSLTAEEFFDAPSDIQFSCLLYLYGVTAGRTYGVSTPVPRPIWMVIEDLGMAAT